MKDEKLRNVISLIALHFNIFHIQVKASLLCKGYLKTRVVNLMAA